MIPPNPVVANTNVTNINSSLGNLAGVDRIVSFGEDANGNLYLVDLFGEVYRILTDKLLAGDYNADGKVDNADYAVWRSTFGTSTGSRPADGNGNGIVDAADYIVWRNNLGADVHLGAGSGGAVPEPATAAYVLVLAAIGHLFSYRAIASRSRKKCFQMRG